MEPFVVYWNNIPAPYMVERFNVVADRGNLDFEAWFNERTEKGRSWEIDESNWRFRYRYLPAVNLLKRNFHWPSPLFRRRPDVLVSLYAEPVFLIGWAITKLRKGSIAFWCQVTHDSWVQRKWWKNYIKKLIFPMLDATLGSGKDSQKFAIQYGIPIEKALCLRHSIDVNHYLAGHKKACAQRNKIREKLELVGTTFIYVGRLWKGKGLGYLLQAFNDAQKEIDKEISLILVGDGKEEAILKKMCYEKSIKNVIFTGFVQKRNLPIYYAASDVFVFPTLGDPYGLVVDEAMASKLPIISSSSVGEITDRVENGVNGYIVSSGNIQGMKEKMLILAKDEKLIKKMGEISLKKIIYHTHERWAVDFENIVSKLITCRKRI